MTEARTLTAQRAMELFNDVQLCHEMGWTYEELSNTPDDFVWAALRILDLEGQKANEDSDASRRGVGPSYDRKGSVQHHRANSPPERVPDFPTPR